MAKQEPLGPSSTGAQDIFTVLRQSTGTDVFDLDLNGHAETETLSPVAAQRRQEILEAALKIFSKKGFDGSRTKEIATEAGVSEATIFKYFPSKRQLLLGIMRPVIEAVAKPVFLAPMTKIINEAATTGLEQALIAIALDRLEVMKKNERLLLTLLGELSRQEDLLAVFRQLLVPLIQGEIKHLYEGGIERGEISPDISVQVFTRNLLGTILGNIMLFKFAPDHFFSEDIKTEITASIRIFVRGIQGGKK